MIIQPNIVKIGGTTPSGGWQRPEDWLPIDNLVSAGDDKFVGLYAIFPNDSLEAPGNTLKMLCNFAWTVNWGDGTTADIATGTEAAHTYDFDTIDANTETSEGYRQVVVTITATSGNMNNYVQIGRPGSTLVCTNWLDIRISSIYITGLEISLSYTAFRLNKFVWLGSTFAGLTIGGVRNVPIHVFQVNWSGLSTLQFLFYLGASLDDLGDIVTNATVIGYLTSGSYVRRIGNVTAQNATTAFYIFNGTLAEEIGDVDIRSATNTAGMLQNAPLIRKIGTINISNSESLYFAFTTSSLKGTLNLITTSALYECSYAFYGSANVTEITLSDASGITSTTGMFSSCPRLASLRLPGIAVSFSVASCNMDATALNTLFGDLATITGDPMVITITGNPGAATCDQTIATAKNWTVVS
ncbi:MAG: hypothetical protein CVU11_13155 [Bacteroidetes bacterium HGW-Bacteroidetes-6]|jgi:hypothetical protein|nr:MAG: hypothetical protein CVU11_13155 [Bacteroidetes bacterium HGW-Bacteroidetes-6]